MTLRQEQNQLKVRVLINLLCASAHEISQSFFELNHKTESAQLDVKHSQIIIPSTTPTAESGSKAFSKEKNDVFNSINASAVSAGIYLLRNFRGITHSVSDHRWG